MGISVKVRCGCRTAWECSHQNSHAAVFSCGLSSYLQIQNIVGGYLENGQRGSKFPQYMDYRPLSHVIFTYSPKNADVLLRELDEIKEALSGKPYPGLVLDYDDDELYPRLYDETGSIVAAAAADGWEGGIDAEGAIFIKSGGSRVAVLGKRLEWSRSGSGYEVDGSGFFATESRIWGVQGLHVQDVDLWREYRYVFEGLLSVCRASSEAGNVIEIS